MEHAAPVAVLEDADPGSGADVAYNLREAGVRVVAPKDEPDPRVALDWVFPNDESGVEAALSRGARVFWVSCPVGLLRGESISIAGQLPEFVQRFEDKAYTNAVLEANGLPVPAMVTIGLEKDAGTLRIDRLTEQALAARGVRFPAVVKPVRGRGGEAVRKVETLSELKWYAGELLAAERYGRRLLVERFLPGEELAVTVMPPGRYRVGANLRVFERHWPLPPVRRGGHHNGIAFGEGAELLTSAEQLQPEVMAMLESCSEAAHAAGARAPVRIDCRGALGQYVLFDVNLQPAMGGPGRPGREAHSLASLAAQAVGWGYRDLLANLLRQAWRAGNPV